MPNRFVPHFVAHINLSLSYLSLALKVKTAGKFSPEETDKLQSRLLLLTGEMSRAKTLEEVGETLNIASRFLETYPDICWTSTAGCAAHISRLEELKKLLNTPWLIETFSVPVS